MFLARRDVPVCASRAVIDPRLWGHANDVVEPGTYVIAIIPYPTYHVPRPSDGMTRKVNPMQKDKTKRIGQAGDYSRGIRRTAACSALMLAAALPNIEHRKK